MREFALSRVRARLRYHDLPGGGTPLLFVHGLGCAATSDYPRVAADPALAGRRMLLVDLLGSGYSDRPAQFGYTVEDHAATLAELAAGLGLPAYDVAGHSMGGAIAIVLAASDPRRVRRLVLSEPNLDPGGGFFSRVIAGWSEAEYVATGHADSVRDAEAAGRTVWAASMRVSAPLAVHRAALSLVRGSAPSWREQLEGLALPRTVLFGAASLPDPDTERLARAGLAVGIVPDAGHAMMCENPSGFAAALAAALS